MKDPLKLIQAIKEILKLIFGDSAPPWIFRLVGILLGFGLVLLGIWGLLFVLDKIRKLLSEKFWPLFYNADKKRRTEKRRRFADHVESEMRRLNTLEQWSDYRFAELEAEVEAEGSRRIPLPQFFFHGVRNTLRREKSLSVALAKSKERLILVEGEPGAGKSVALRHLVQTGARKAMRSRNAGSIIPVYVNLRELERTSEQPINRKLIQDFVLSLLNRINDRDIEEFLEEEFEAGLRQGTWLFLFDSFDEIPEILSSVGADKAITEYAQAIADFLGGMNRCRGIVASRQFRGPGQLGWPRFRVLTLSEKRQRELIRRAGLSRLSESQFFVNLVQAREEIRAMASNPMFLGLLCEQSRTGREFPQSAHTVFETYLEMRLTRDSERLERRFKLEPKQVRKIAEAIAFCMAADSGLGLSPLRAHLKAGLVQHGFLHPEDLDMAMDALEFIKLARQGATDSTAQGRTFTFAHRRFQEYFATCVVLDDFGRVKPEELLINGRWRETAVVLFQTQSLDRLAPMIEAVTKYLSNMVSAIPVIPRKITGSGEEEKTDGRAKSRPRAQLVRTPFPWPSGALHLLGILQEGFGRRMGDLPDRIQVDASRLVSTASAVGLLSDRKWALDVGGCVKPSLLVWLLRSGFSTSSQWLRDVAYRQTGRLSHIPKDISECLCTTLVQMTVQGKISREWLATKAHLSRLEKHQSLLAVAALLRFLRPFDLAIHFFLALYVLDIFKHQLWFALFRVLLIGVSASLLFFQPANVLREILRRRPTASEFSVMDAFMTVVMRFALLELPTRSMESIFHANKTRAVIFILLSAYGALWAPISLLAAKSSEFVGPLWWPIIPAWPLLYLSRDLKGRLAILSRWIRRRKWLLAVQVLAMLIFAGGVILAQKYVLLRWIFAGLFTASMIVTVVWPGVVYASLLLRDLITSRKWQSLPLSSLTLEELLGKVESLRTIRFRVYLLETVYQEGLLKSGDHAEAGLVNQLTKLQQEKNYHSEYPVIEALSRLLEQLRARRLS